MPYMLGGQQALEKSIVNNFEEKIISPSVPKHVGDHLVLLDLASWFSNAGEGSGTPLQCSCLEDPMNKGAWQVIVQRVPMS